MYKPCIIGNWAPIYMFGEQSKYIINANTAKIINTETGKSIKHVIDKDGYHRVGLYHNGKHKTYIVSRLVYIAFNGDSEFNDIINQVNHINGNKDDNSLYNLEVCSSQYNIRHAIDNKLRDNTGIHSSLNKYPESTIHNILELLEKKYSIKYISKKLNIPRTNISDIKRGRTWKHLSSTYDIPDYTKRKNKEVIIGIIRSILDGLSNKEVSDLYKVDKKYVSLIRNKKRHKELFDTIEKEYAKKGSTTIESPNTDECKD